MALSTVTSRAEAEQLADRLRSPRRALPVVVVSTPSGSPTSPVDVDRLAAACGALAEVVLVPTGDVTRRLAELLPERCAVWGGAGRVYPVGDAWQRDPLRSPLRFVHRPEDAAWAGERLLEDALAMAAAAGLVGDRPAEAAPVVRGVVELVLAAGTRAFVRTERDALVTISAELAAPGVPIDWYAPVGTPVTGRLQTASRLLQVDLAPGAASAVLAHFGSGAVTLALVASSDRQEAVLQLHPAVPVRVHRADVSSNPLDLVSQLLGAGEVVPVRIVRDPQGRLALRLDDVEDDEPLVPALPLVEGGPPWLQPGRDLLTAPVEEEPPLPDAVEPPVPAPVDAPPPVPPRPGPGRRKIEARPPPAPPAAPVPSAKALVGLELQLDTVRAENRRLKAQQTLERAADARSSALLLELGQERARVADYKQQLRRAQREGADLRQRARGASAAQRTRPISRDRFDDAEQWIRHEVHLAWIDRLDPAERRRRPIDSGWTVGAAFAASLEPLSDAQLHKTFRAMVDVVTGFDTALDGREAHRLRTGPGGDDPFRARPSDGATAWRVAIERSTASARRLHYWRTRDAVEFARVVLHDDVRI